MPYFFFEGSLEPGQTGELKGMELKHARLSRKIRTGEEIHLQDSLHLRFKARVEFSKNNFLRFQILEKLPTPSEPDLKISLYLTPIKEKPLDWVLQKATELGASNIYLFPSAYSGKLPQPPVLATRLERWERICKEACKQSERVLPPALGVLENFEKAAQHSLDNHDASLIFHHLGEAETRLPKLGKPSSLGFFVGPEGGFTEEEANQERLTKIKLGPRVMKAETAAVTGLGLLQYLFGDLGEPRQPTKDC